MYGHAESLAVLTPTWIGVRKEIFLQNKWQAAGRGAIRTHLGNQKPQTPSSMCRPLSSLAGYMCTVVEDENHLLL